MTGNERREKLIQIIRDGNKPISGGELAKMLGVSRQVIVQDIALLRASDFDIISTTKGYMLYQTEDKKIKRVFMVKHSTKDIEDELCTIVDNGERYLMSMWFMKFMAR